jgi:hypothetical protein
VGFGAVVALVGLVFSMISIRLMSIVENTQIRVSRTVKAGNTRLSRASKGTRGNKVVVLAISTPKLVFLRIGVIFFGRISAIIFIAEEMYPARVVEGAALTMMKTVLISNQIRVATVRHGRHAIRKIKKKNSVNRSPIKYS